MSTHRVEVVAAKLEKHPNADALSVVRIADYAVCVRSADWKDGDLGAYIEPDYIVPADRPEFAFLAGLGSKVSTNNGVTGFRIRVKRLRGVMSMGLLVPAPAGLAVGDNAMEVLGVARYEPVIPLSGGEADPAPSGVRPCYDVESAYKYAHLFTDGEEVVVTEKIHGANARYCFVPGDGMFCGSRTEWKKQAAGNQWWRALEKTPGLQEFCEAHPELTVYGEVYGQVQDLNYGHGRGELSFIAFDLLRAGAWVDHDEARSTYQGQWVPLVYRGPWIKDKVFALADGKSALADHIQEGVVVKPIRERSSVEIGRVQLKLVSNAYLERQ